MSSILDDFASKHKPFSQFSTADVMPFFNRAQTRDRRKQIADEIKVYEAGDAPQKKIAAELTKKLEAYDALADDIQAYRELLDESATAAEPTTPEEKQKRIEKAEEINNKLSKSYIKYLKVLASSTGQQILDEQTYPSLNGIKDYMALDKESRSMGEFINHLHDPDNFVTIVNRRRTATMSARRSGSRPSTGR